MHVYLFDIDGVLVHPVGYRVALQATVNHFSRAMGLGDCAPDEPTIAVFEAHGITSEWDSAPICLAALLAAAHHARPDLRLPPDLPAALAAIRAQGLSAMPVNYAALARRVAKEIRPGEYPALAARRVFEGDAGAAQNGRRAELNALLRALLSHTRDVHRSPTFAVFQQHTLGSQAYAETYGLSPTLDVLSTLLRHDRPALSPENRGAVLAAVRDSRFQAAVYTSRPSLPPRRAGVSARGYAPEAEMAVSLVGLGDLSLIGFGRLQWLASVRDADAEGYVKPSPVHALAAIGAAWAGDEHTALLAAERLAEHNEVIAPLDALVRQQLEVTVFEDSAGGIRAVQRAAELLAAAGIPTTVTAFGIATHPEKQARLAATGAQVFEDVNAALQVRRTLVLSGAEGSQVRCT